MLHIHLVLIGTTLLTFSLFIFPFPEPWHRIPPLSDSYRGRESKMKLLLIYIFLDVRALAADNLCIRMDLFSLLSFPFSFGKFKGNARLFRVV